MAELALYDHKRHAFASHFDGMGVPQLVWSEPSAPLRPDGPSPLASASHEQYDRTTAAPAGGQIERVRRRGEAVDPAHGNPDLAIAEPLGHAREPATVRLHVDIDNRHPARPRRRRAGDRGQPPAVGDGGEGGGLTAIGG